MSPWVNRYQNAMSALRPFIPQSQTGPRGAANDAKGHKLTSGANQKLVAMVTSRRHSAP